MQSASTKMEKMREAVRLMKEGASLRAVAREFGIAPTTLHDKAKGKSPLDHNRNQELTIAEEEGLATWIKGMAPHGFGRNQVIFADQVKKILDQQGRQTRFTNNRPGKDEVPSRPYVNANADVEAACFGSSTWKVQNWFKEFKAHLEAEENVDPAIWEEAK